MSTYIPRGYVDEGVDSVTQLYVKRHGDFDILGGAVPRVTVATTPTSFLLCNQTTVYQPQLNGTLQVSDMNVTV